MAGCYDRTRVVSKSRGTRSQFRLGSEGLLPFKCSYPVHLTDIMDTAPTQSGIGRLDPMSPPVRGNHTRAVRESEQIIDGLRKENFDLKLKIFLLEENLGKTFSKGEQDSTVQIAVQLQLEVETLRTELSNKTQQLQDALEQAESFSYELRIVQQQFERQQQKLSSLADVPSQQEISLLKEESENLLLENKVLSDDLSAKSREIQASNSQLEKLIKRNRDLEDKYDKCKLAIQGFVQKYAGIPDNLLPVVRTAAQAAKEQASEDLPVVMENFQNVLCQMMQAEGEASTSISMQRSRASSKNISVRESSTSSCASQSLRSVENDKSSAKSHSRDDAKESLSKTASGYWQESTAISSFENSKESENEFPSQANDFLEEDASTRVKSCQKLIDDLTASCEDQDVLSKSVSPGAHRLSRSRDSFEKLGKRELEQMSRDLKENVDLKATCDELRNRVRTLENELEEMVSKLSEVKQSSPSLPVENASVQTSIQWPLVQSDTFLQNVGHSDNVDELKEEILTLLLMLEQRDKEMYSVEESMNVLQEQLAETKDKSGFAFDHNAEAEIHELHQRLAQSCSTNNELMKHLRSLETFLEDLLHHRNLDSESVNEASELLDQTLKLSSALNDHLSICEASKLFDPSVSSTSLLNRQSYSYQLPNQSRPSIDVSTTQGKNSFLSSLQEPIKNAAGTGKRRLRFTEKEDLDRTLVGSENVVVLGTSNNEDLILLLNDNGVPEDVLIRNNRSHLDKAVSAEDRDQAHRRCWESNAMDRFDKAVSAEDRDQAHRRCWESNAMDRFDKAVSVEDRDQAHRRCWESNAMDRFVESHSYNQQFYGDPAMIGIWRNHCQSSDSDIWSEPDRDVSLQRIGIDVQKSPLTQNSPRRSRLREKLSTDEIGTAKDETSCSFPKVSSWSKRRKSGGPSKSSFICKKCSSHYYPTGEYESSQIENLQEKASLLTVKCNSQEQEIEDLKESLNRKTSSIESLTEEKQKLSSQISNLKKEIAELKRKKSLLALETTKSSEKVAEENEKLRETLKEYEMNLTDHSAVCDQLEAELEKTRARLNNLDSKCVDYENRLSASAEDKERYAERLRALEEEKIELSAEIKRLVKEKDSLTHSLQIEKEKRQNGNAENQELRHRLQESAQEVSHLQESCERLEEAKSTLLKEKESCIGEYTSVHATCSELQNDLKATEGRLENLQAKCDMHEKELSQMSARYSIVVESLSNVRSELSSNLHALTDVCRQHFDSSEDSLNNSGSQTYSPAVELYGDIMRMNKMLQRKIEFLSEELSSIHSKLLEGDSKSDVHLKSINKLCEAKENEINDLKGQNEELQNRLFELGQNLEHSEYLKSNFRLKASETQKSLEALRSDSLEKQNQWRTIIEEIQIALEEKNNALETSRQKMALSQSEIAALKEAIAKYQTSLEAKEADVNKLQSFVRDLQNGNDKKEFSEDVQKSSSDLELNASRNDLEKYQYWLNMKDEEIERLRGTITEWQQACDDEKKLLDSECRRTRSLQTDLDSVLQEMKNSQSTLQLKDEEIKKLREHVFYLQSRLGSLSSERAMSAENIHSKSFVTECEANNRSASEWSVESETRPMHSRSEYIEPSKIDSEGHKKTSDRYIKKIKHLQAKLAMGEKQIEMLKKEKQDLRQDLLAYVRGDKKIGESSQEISLLQTEMEDLKTKLQDKTSFIKELKQELHKTSNSLVDAQSEVNVLKSKITEIELQSKYGAVASSSRTRLSEPSLNGRVEGNIEGLKRQKWELLQNILDQQQEFYQRKKIHLGHFEKFRNHIDKMHSLQDSPYLTKSGSVPALNTELPTEEKHRDECDGTFGNLRAELILDVEYLQNLKIFLKRFFIPLVLESKPREREDPYSNGGNAVASKTSILEQAEEISDSKRERPKSLRLKKSSDNSEVLQRSADVSPRDRFLYLASLVSYKLDVLDNAFSGATSALEHLNEVSLEESPRKSAARSLLMKILDVMKSFQAKLSTISQFNCVLKSLGLFEINVPQSPNKQDMSDRESLLSEEIIAISRNGSLSPMSFEGNFLPKSTHSRRLSKEQNHQAKTETISRPSPLGPFNKESHDSLFQRSHFSSPDLGIESDPNHESSAPEQIEKGADHDTIAKVSKRLSADTKIKQWEQESPKHMMSSLHSLTKDASKILEASNLVIGGTLHAVGYLNEYELLKKEVQESLIGVKTVISRTLDGLQRVSKYASPRKNFEYATFKAIRDESTNIDVCLKEASKLIDNFWIAPCPSAQELNNLIQLSQMQQEELVKLKASKSHQEKYFKEIMDKLEHEKTLRENMEKKVSQRLVKTKKVIRNCNAVMEKNNQLPLPKYPMEPSSS